MSHLTFNDLFTAIQDVIPYDRGWSNGVGFHSHAVSGPAAPKLSAGQMVKSISPGGRRMVFLGTSDGNVVIYDRYCITEKKQAFVYNAPQSYVDIVKYPQETLLDGATLKFIIDEFFCCLY